MAALADLICPRCGAVIVGDPDMCPLPCFEPRPAEGWAPRPPDEGERVGPTATTGAAASPQPHSTATIRCPNPACQGQIACDADSCLFCGQTISSGGVWELDVLGHRLIVAPGRPVVIGRGLDSPVARVLADHTNISRCHCEVRAVDGLEVRDRGSANGTFLDEQAIGSQWQPVAPGTALRLASDLVIPFYGPTTYGR